jgi:spermidine synthase
MKHGIDTTVVELDPVVVKFAKQYFNFPSNQAVVVDDATKFVKRALKAPSVQQYDYIVHDVFTGGAEPAELFTVDFLHQLSFLLKDDGVIAIVSLIKSTHQPRLRFSNILYRTTPGILPSTQQA